MRSLLRVGIGVVCLLAVVLITNSSLPSAYPPDPARWKLLALQPGDVPRGFVQTLSQPFPNRVASKAVHASADFYDKLGRVGGYRTAYRRRLAVRLFYLDSYISEFRTQPDAQRFQAIDARGIIRFTGYGAHFKPLPAVQLGDHARAYSVTYAGRGRTYTVIVLYFRRGVLAAALDAQGFAGTFKLVQVVALGHRINTRFKRQRSPGQSAADAPLIHAAVDFSGARIAVPTASRTRTRPASRVRFGIGAAWSTCGDNGLWCCSFSCSDARKLAEFR